MITFFACPKPFHGHTAIIQRNAIESWTRLRPTPEIILVGIDEGVAEISKELGLVHAAEVERNQYGTPMVNSVFHIGQTRASHSVVCYINSDIILTGGFTRVTETVAAKMPRFLITGQRWDVDIRESYKYDSPGWEAGLRVLLARNGALHGPSGMDFFCFPRGMYTQIPPFALGRLKWDNWLVWRARSKGIPIVDVTAATPIIHQNHEYARATIRRLSDGEVDLNSARDSARRRLDGHWVELGPEAQGNVALVPEEENLHIWAATWVVNQKGLLVRRPFTLNPAYLYYQLKCIAPLYWPFLGRLVHSALSVRTALLRGGKDGVRRREVD